MSTTQPKCILDYDLNTQTERQFFLQENISPEEFAELLANAEWNAINSRVFHSVIDQRSYYLKIFHDRRLRNTIARRLRIKDHDAFREVKTLTKLNSCGFITISPCAAFIGYKNQREHSLLVSYDFLQDNPYMLPLDQYLIGHPAQSNLMLDKLADLLVRMFSQKFIHLDIHCGNFLTDGHRLVILDTDDIYQGRSERQIYKSLDMAAKNMLRDRDILKLNNQQIHSFINRMLVGTNIAPQQAYSRIIQRHCFKYADQLLRRMKGKIDADELKKSVQVPAHLVFFKPMDKV